MSARIGAATRQPRGDPLLRLFRLAGPLRGRLLLAAVTGALATICGLALLAVSGFLLARASQHPGIAALAIAVVAVRGLSIGRGVFRYAERLASHDVAFRVLARTRVAIWRKLETLAPAGLPAFRSADLLSRLVGDVDATQDLFIRGIAPPVAAALAGAAAVGACLTLLGRAGMLLAAGLLAGGILVPMIALRAARTSARRSAHARGEVSHSFNDIVVGAADLQAFGAAESALERVEGANRQIKRLDCRSASAAGMGLGLASLTAGLTLWGVLVLGVAAVGSGALSRVPLAVLALTALAAFEAVTTLPAAAVQLSHARTAATRIAEVMDAPQPVTDPPDPRPLPLAGTRGITVRLRDAQLRYWPGGPLAIDGIDLDLTPGRRVALVGPPGAGKSTIAAVLVRFRNLTGGSATLAGHDLDTYRADDVRSMIGGCAQDPHLFNASIAENLRLARPGATDAALAAVTERVGLADWIGTLPRGMETQVGVGGSAVSGGQRQRIALARALLADPAVLILDEPTAHVDSQSRRALAANLLAITAGRAVLLITHDLDGLDHVDEIIVLHRGRVAERGTHAALLANRGLYWRMYGAQFGHRGL
jgi:thiol reductant ABC exporter CydC subunit